jgi:hypothetical protein
MNSTMLNLTIAVLENKDWVSHMMGYLNFGDMRNLSISSKTTRDYVSSVIAKWPVEIRKLLATWCHKRSAPIMISGASIEGCNYDNEKPPVVQFKAESLAFNSETSELQGRPYSLIAVKSDTTGRLGDSGAIACFANEEKTLAFYCGGFANYEPTTAADMFDTVNEVWLELPSMPSPRDFAGICRIGSRIYIAGGFRTEDHNYILCFDLDLTKWVNTWITVPTPTLFVRRHLWHLTTVRSFW